MNKPLLITIGVVAMVIAIPLLVYALNYQGEYEVTVSCTVTPYELGLVSVTEVEVSSEPMSYFAFYEGRGHAPDRSETYGVFVELTQGSDTIVAGASASIPVDESHEFSITLYEVQPGETTVRIYVESLYTQSIIYDDSFSEVIG